MVCIKSCDQTTISNEQGGQSTHEQGERVKVPLLPNKVGKRSGQWSRHCMLNLFLWSDYSTTLKSQLSLSPNLLHPRPSCPWPFLRPDWKRWKNLKGVRLKRPTRPQTRTTTTMKRGQSFRKRSVNFLLQSAVLKTGLVWYRRPNPEDWINRKPDDHIKDQKYKKPYLKN